MPRLAPSFLALVAAVSLISPPATLVHAHEGGHEPHAHGPRGAVHVALVPPADARPHAHPHSHPHPHPHGIAGTAAVPEERPHEEPGRESGDEPVPESHVHVDGDLDGLARSGTAARLPCADSRWAPLGAAVAPLAQTVCASRTVPVPRRRSSVPRPPPRLMDRLVRAGSLLF